MFQKAILAPHMFTLFHKLESSTKKYNNIKKIQIIKDNNQGASFQNCKKQGSVSILKISILVQTVHSF